MKSLIALITLAGLVGLPGATKAQFDTSVPKPFFRDSVFPPNIIDSLTRHGVYVMMSGGGAVELFGNAAGTTCDGGVVDLTTVFGKNVIDFSYAYMSGGSITTGTASGFIIYNPAPTVPVVASQILSASYGQRISPTFALTAGLAYIQRTINTPTIEYTKQAEWFSSGGTYWEYSTKNESYFAVPIAASYYWRWASWLGGVLKAEVLCNGREVSGSVGFSIGIGSFPDASTHWKVMGS